MEDISLLHPMTSYTLASFSSAWWIVWQKRHDQPEDGPHQEDDGLHDGQGLPGQSLQDIQPFSEFVQN